MPKITMLKTLAGPTVSYRMGEEYDVEPAFADALCADGRAELVEAEPKPTRKRRERASKAPAAKVETRTKAS